MAKSKPPQSGKKQSSNPAPTRLKPGPAENASAPPSPKLRVVVQENLKKAGSAKRTTAPVRPASSGNSASRAMSVPPPKRERAAPPPVRTALGTNGETIELVDPEKPLPRTKLNARELRRFKALLLVKRRELLGDVIQLSSEALRNNRQDGSGDLSNMPTHMADIGSDNWEQEFTIGLIATERALLREIDDALLRIEDRTFGVCVGTHRMISVQRLEAKPWARYCIEYARLREAGRAP